MGDFEEMMQVHNLSTASKGKTMLFRSWYHTVLATLLCVTNTVTYYWFHKSRNITPATSPLEAVNRSDPPVVNAPGGQPPEPVYPSCCRLAFEHTLGFIDDVPNQIWTKHYQNPSLNPLMYRNETFPDDQASNHAQWHFQNMDPWFNCPRRQRLGGIGNRGPKVTCDPDRLKFQLEQRDSQLTTKTYPRCLVYSFLRGGIDTYAWEEALAEVIRPQSCEIHVFDSAERSGKAQWREPASMITFHPWRLVGAGDHDGSTATATGNEALRFDDIQKRLGHEGRTIDLFKIDCHGCEWSTWRDWVDADIRQLLIKVYGSHGSPSEMFGSFLSRGFELFSKEPDCLGAGPNDHTGTYCTSTDYSWIRMSPEFRTTRRTP